MQLVIEISDGLYNNLDTIKNGSIASKIILDCVRKGQVLPKGHGRLIDVDEIPIDCDYYDVDNAQTIIEADKEDRKMAKRELIDREKAENITWGEPSYTDALNVLTEVRDKIRELPAITEQEIVKPYLEKLKSEVVKTIERYKLRMPPTVYYELLSDIMNMEDEK